MLAALHRAAAVVFIQFTTRSTGVVTLVPAATVMVLAVRTAAGELIIVLKAVVEVIVLSTATVIVITEFTDAVGVTLLDAVISCPKYRQTTILSL